MVKVIGIVGLIGSGKDTVINYLSEKYGIQKITISDLVKNIAAERKLAPTRETLVCISLEYIHEYGQDYFPKEICRIIKNSKWSIVAVAGIRSFTDTSTFRKKFERNFTLVHIDVSTPAIRFNRIQKRDEPRDPKTLEAFIEQDMREESIFKISRAISEADYTLRNDKDLDELYRQIDDLMAKIFDGEIEVK